MSKKIKLQPEEIAFKIGVAVDTDNKVAHLFPEATIRTVAMDNKNNGAPTSSPIPNAKAADVPDRVNPAPFIIEYLPHAHWGISDQLPNTIINAMITVPMSSRAVQETVSKLVGNGVYYVKDSELQKGDSVVKRYYDKNIDLFLLRNRIYSNFLTAVSNDLSSVYNAFVEFLMNAEGDEIVQVARKEAQWCRVSRINPVSLRSEWLYYSAAFGFNMYPDYNDTSMVAKIPLYDPTDFLFFDKLRAKGIRRFAMHIKPPTAQAGYYAIAPWTGLYLEDGWVFVAQRVSKIVSAMQNNQIALKYLILISNEYLAARYPKWTGGTPEEKQEIQERLTKQIEDKIVGVKNVYSSLTIIAREGPDGKLMGRIEIVPIEDKAKSGTWIPDTAAANREILYGHNVHPTLVGIQAQGGSEAGSGSDKLQSSNDFVSKLSPLRAQVFAPLNEVIKVFNNWDVTFFADNVLMTTQNNQETGIVPTNQRPSVIN